MVPSSCPITGSQSFTVPSNAPEASILLSGENATHHRPDLCPRSANRSCPFVVFHTFTVLSCLREAEASIVPSGESATENTPSRRTRQLKRRFLWHCCHRKYHSKPRKSS